MNDIKRNNIIPIMLIVVSLIAISTTLMVINQRNKKDYEINSEIKKI